MQYPLKTLIVEDNPDDAELLTIYLGQTPDLFQLPPTLATTFESAALILATTKFDISFLDYNLDNSLLWYDLIELVGIKNMGVIVSHTATKKSDLERTQRAKNYILLQKTLIPTGMAKFLVDLDERVTERQGSTRFRYSVFENRENIFLDDDDIIYLESDGNYTHHFLLRNDLPPKLTITKQIAKVFATLNPSVFVRCHDEFVVNINHIRRLVKNNNSGGYLVLDNKAEIPFTKSFRANLVEKGFLPEKD